MAMVDADWSVTQSTKVIDYTGNDHGGGSPSYATVAQFHKWLQDKADDETWTGNDELQISSLNPSSRSTDQIITLINGYTITDTAAEHLYDGSIIQNDGDDVWDGIVNFGNSAVQIQIHQDGAVLSDDWWNFGGGGLNADAANGISHRFMLKVRSDGADIDGRRLLGTCRRFTFSFNEFRINGTSNGVNVFALVDADDGNNNTSAGTVATWDQFSNTTEGYVGLDVNNDSTDEFYYSEWAIGGGATPASPTINDLYEYTKYITRDGSASTLYGVNGELFRGITHQVQYDGEAGTGPTEGNLAVWGTTFDYNNELASGLTVGEYYTFGTSNAVGKLIGLDDNGTTGTVVFAIEPGSGTVVNTESFVRSDGTATDGADVNSVPADTAAVGGEGLILADDGTANIWIQLLAGGAPVDNIPMYDATLAGVYDPANTWNADTNITERTISTPFIGGSTGSAISPGAYGLGIDPTDLSQNDLLRALDNVQYQPPNFVTFNVGGLVSGEDRVLVGPWDGSSTDPNGDPAFDLDQLSLNTTLSGATETSVVVTASIPADTPNTGWLRIELDDGEYVIVDYTSWTGSTFTITSTDFSGGTYTTATATNNVMIAYIDKLAGAATESFTGVYTSDRDLVILVRDGGGTPIKQYIASATLGSGGGSSTAIRTSDA